MQAASHQADHDREDLNQSLQTILFRLSSITRLPQHVPSRLPRRQISSLGYDELEKWAFLCSLQQELRRLKEDLAVVYKSLIDSRSYSSEERNAFDHTEQRISALEALNHRLLDSVPITARPTAASAEAAQRVFNVEELLERVLPKCDFYHLLAIGLVNQSFAQAFQSSSKLRQLIGLQPANGGSPSSPLASSFFISCGCSVRLEHRHPMGMNWQATRLLFRRHSLTPIHLRSKIFGVWEEGSGACSSASHQSSR